MPPAWATAGMIRASGGGVFFEPGETGWTRFTFTVVALDVACARAEPKRTEIEAVLVPTGRAAVLAVTVSVRVSEVVVPLEGSMVIHGSFAVAVKGWPACVGNVNGEFKGCGSSAGAAALVVCVGRTATTTAGE